MRKIIGTELLIVKGWRQLTLIEGREGRHSGDLADPSCCANLYQTGSMRGSQRHHIGTLAKKQSVNNSPTVPSRAVSWLRQRDLRCQSSLSSTIEKIIKSSRVSAASNNWFGAKRNWNRQIGRASGRERGCQYG